MAKDKLIASINQTKLLLNKINRLEIVHKIYGELL
jgi:hypothetical protein